MVLLDIFNLSDKSHDLPRRLEVFGKFCDLFWYQALPFCRYCKSEGHFIKDCLLLQSKNTQKIDKNSLLNVISSSATNISLVVPIDLPQSTFRFEIDIPPEGSLISSLQPVQTCKVNPFNSKTHGKSQVIQSPINMSGGL